MILIVGNAHEGKGILHDAILLDDSLFYRLMIHDWERREYKQLVNNVGFSIETVSYTHLTLPTTPYV